VQGCSPGRIRSKRKREVERDMDRNTGGIMNQYWLWREKAVADQELGEELKGMEQEPDRIREAFYRELVFGTGGLRGILGAGTNRMNVYTVAKVTQGLADHIRKKSEQRECSVAVSYDSRIKSELFARTASAVLAANGLRVFLFPRLMPTPCLSYAVRRLGCFAGIMITASHNPAEYNGYKVYGADGCQITTEAAADILEEIRKLDIFSDVKQGSFEDGVRGGRITYIPDEVDRSFIEEVKKQSLWGEEGAGKEISVVYSPLNGTGLKPVLRALRESGYTDITVVEEQREPDGRFPTCPRPNPEVKAAMELGIRYAREKGADLVLATDPDCDRVGVAVRDHKGEYTLLSGNETGLLLLDYVCARRKALGTMPEEPVFMKTIVTTAMAERIASCYGVKTVNVLTGFKFIGEQLGFLEAEGKEDSFIFAFEESYGYLSGSYVRDKDGVGASLLICEMAAFCKSRGISLAEKLEELYRTYGYCLDTQHCYEFEGARGSEQMAEIMKRFRENPFFLGEKRIVSFLDYRDGLDGLPKSDVVRFSLEDGCSVVVRPSGTEPKIKVYVSVRGESRGAAAQAEGEIVKEIEQVIG